MSGLLTALRGSTRTAGLIRKGRNKMHVASIRVGDTHWVTLCDRDVLAAGTTFWADTTDAGVQTEQHPEALCAYCHRFILLAALLVDRASTPVRAHRIA